MDNNMLDNTLEQNTNVEETTTKYVDEFGNPIDPSLIDEFGNYIGNKVNYVDEFGNPIDPSLIDEFGNYIGNQVESQEPTTIQENGSEKPKTIVDQTELTKTLNSIAASSIGTIPTTPNNVNRESVESNTDLANLVKYDYNNIPITDIVNSIILDSIKKKASDIHLDPYQDGIKIRIRIDGVLKDYSIVPLFVKKNMITRIKIISGLNITETRIPQDGAIRTMLNGNTIDLRVSCLPTNMGEKVVMRIMDYTKSNDGVEALDFSEVNLGKVKKMMELPNGIILVTGATGSGKSTTVYSMLQKLNVESTNIITVEDPIEMSIPGINQVQAQSEIGLDFATVLRSILRQDPDVIMIGEIRDDETARIAVRASITGHLVLSTVHTNNSLATIERLTDMSVERYLLGTSLSGIISQKLAKRLCPHCKKKRRANKYERVIFKQALGIDVDRISVPQGCPECINGYKGRIAIHEVLYLSQDVRDAITSGASKQVLREAVYNGENPTISMLQDGLQKVLDGNTSFEEIIKLIDIDEDYSIDITSLEFTEGLKEEELGETVGDINPDELEPFENLYDDVDYEIKDFVFEPIEKLSENEIASKLLKIFREEKELEELDKQIKELQEITINDNYDLLKEEVQEEVKENNNKKQINIVKELLPNKIKTYNKSLINKLKNDVLNLEEKDLVDTLYNNNIRNEETIIDDELDQTNSIHIINFDEMAKERLENNELQEDYLDELLKDINNLSSINKRDLNNDIELLDAIDEEINYDIDEN